MARLRFLRLLAASVLRTPSVAAVVVAGGLAAALAVVVLPAVDDGFTPVRREPVGTAIAAPTDPGPAVKPSATPTSRPDPAPPAEIARIADLPEPTPGAGEPTPTPRIIVPPPTQPAPTATPRALVRDAARLDTTPASLPRTGPNDAEPAATSTRSAAAPAEPTITVLRAVRTEQPTPTQAALTARVAEKKDPPARGPAGSDDPGAAARPRDDRAGESESDLPVVPLSDGSVRRREPPARIDSSDRDNARERDGLPGLGGRDNRDEPGAGSRSSRPPAGPSYTPPKQPIRLGPADRDGGAKDDRNAKDERGGDGGRDDRDQKDDDRDRDHGKDNRR